MTIEPGQVIDDKYRIVRIIGEGGMGAVYEGENLRIHRRVAIKVLNAAWATNSEIVARFEREAQAAGRIGNDHILEVIDLGSLPNGNRYMVMEYLEGETLLARIQKYGKLEPERIVPIARQFLSALSAAHAAGVIHRDLKPENIFIIREKAGRSDFVKLIDFGVSKFTNLGAESQRFTRAGSVMGTPCYMAPEQARGRGEVDVRSDIYAVGVMLYEAVTGQLPFDSESFNDLMFKIALSDPPTPRSLLPTLDADFERIIQQAMMREPSARYQTVDELASALDEWALQHDVPLLTESGRHVRLSLPDSSGALERVGARAETLIAVSPDQATDADDLEIAALAMAKAKRRKMAIGAGAASAFALVGIAIVLATAGSAEPPRSSGLTQPVPTSSAGPIAAEPLPTNAGATLAGQVDPAAAAASLTPLVEPKPVSSTVAASASAKAAPTASQPKPKPKPQGKKTPDFGY